MIRFLLIFMLSSAGVSAQVYKPRPVTALLGAFDAEVKLVQQSLKRPRTQVIHGISFTTGTLGGRRVVVAQTGIGKTNAAMTTTLLLVHFRPERVLFTGIAGGVNPDLQPGDIVIARQTGYHDYRSITFDQRPTTQTYSATGRQLNPAYFPADSALLQRALRTARSLRFEPIPGPSAAGPTVVVGTVVTGDEFISSPAKVAQLRRDHQADATEMEGAAVAQVCYQQRVPCLIIRSLSDRADADARRDMLQFLQVAARNSAKLVLAIASDQ